MLTEFTICSTLGAWILILSPTPKELNETCRHALQLRQAKLSFNDVHLLVGVNSDEQVQQHKARTVMNHAERSVHLCSIPNGVTQLCL